MHYVQVNPGAQRFTVLDLKSRYWEIIKLNLVKRSVTFRSPWRPLGFFWNSRGIHQSLPYVASPVCPLWGGRGVAKSSVKLIQTSPEALSWQVAPQSVLRAVPRAVNGLGSCWRSTRSPAVWKRMSFASGQVVAGQQWSSEVQRWEPFELLTAGETCLVSMSLFFFHPASGVSLESQADANCPWCSGLRLRVTGHQDPIYCSYSPAAAKTLCLWCDEPNAHFNYLNQETCCREDWDI